MATGRWIRIDVGFDESDWLIDLSPASRLAWIKLLAHVKRDGVAGRCRCLSARSAAVVWRLPVEEVETMLAAAQVPDPKDSDPALRVDDTSWEVVHWPDYQVVDETAADRMKRYRANKSRLSPLRRNNRNGPSRTVTDRNRCHATETETETETEEQIPPVVPLESEFSTFWEGYPKRAGSSGKVAAKKAWAARMKEGVSVADLTAGRDRYARYLEAEGKVGTSFVKLASTFLGPGEHWKDEFTLPSTNGKADVEQLVADVLYLVEQGGTILDIPDEREHALEDLSRKHPVQWGRAGPWMENLKLGRIRGEGGRDREHEIRTQIRQLNGVVHG